MKNFTRNFMMSIALCFALASAEAQFVTIPDANFRNWLNAYYPGCINGNLMDTTCSSIVNATQVNCYGLLISNLTGVTYFDNLKTLECGNNYLTSLPQLPASLNYLDCRDNNITILPPLPSTLQILICSGNQISTWSALPPSLTYLKCDNNQLNSLPSLPSSLGYLDCSWNQLTFLSALPASLTSLRCNSNQLTSLPALPSSLGLLTCGYNQLTSLPALPNTLGSLICDGNTLNVLPSLPSSLSYLSCYGNNLTSLPILPSSLTHFFCGNNQLSSFPVLPAALTTLWCFTNQLTSLPVFPSSLKDINCSYNQLTSLPALPATIRQLQCNNNLLTSLPALPDSMYQLYINDNPGLTCLPSIHKIPYFQWANTGITCLPNSISVGSATPTITGVPICTTPTAPTSITVTGGSAKVCPGDTRTYTTPLVTGVTYNWTVPTGAIINSGQGTRTINVTYNSGFISNGAISVVKKQGCGVSLPKTLAVNRNLPSTPSAITGTTYGLCGATNKTYSVTPVAGLTYQWTIPTGVTIVNGQGTNSITVNFPSTNLTGNISVAASNACGVGAARILTVRTIPATPLMITGSATACANQQNVSYSTSLVAIVSSYNWLVPSGALITSGQGTNSIMMKFGTAGGNVRVRASNACGNSSYKNIAVAINCRIGAEDLQSLADIFVYPNPTKNYFTINIINTTESNYSLIIRDVIGRVVYQKSTISSNESFEFGEELLSGVYFAEIEQGNGRKIVRLIKSN